MTNIDTGLFKARLETEKTELEDELKKHGKFDEETKDWQGSFGGIETDPADKNEVADQIEDLVTNIPIVESLEKRYHNVVRALKKIEDGTYGKCDECNKEIPTDRLEANPAATMCIEHAE